MNFPSTVGILEKKRVDFAKVGELVGPGVGGLKQTHGLGPGGLVVWIPRIPLWKGLLLKGPSIHQFTS